MNVPVILHQLHAERALRPLPITRIGIVVKILFGTFILIKIINRMPMRENIISAMVIGSRPHLKFFFFDSKLLSQVLVLGIA